MIISTLNVLYYVLPILLILRGLSLVILWYSYWRQRCNLFTNFNLSL